MTRHDLVEHLRYIGAALGAVAIGTALGVALFFLLIAPVAAVAADAAPREAARYRGELIRNARLAWGLNAPVATFAAQIHQESGWNPRAVSRVGARGMAQFMPATAAWWCNRTREAACTPENPAWAMRALTGYDRWLWDRVAEAGGECERMRATLRSYNGGLGWVQREMRSGRPCEAFRSAANCAENLGYPRRIVDVIQPRYSGWGRGVCA